MTTGHHGSSLTGVVVLSLRRAPMTLTPWGKQSCRGHQADALV
jgi:hypothetical protein